MTDKFDTITVRLDHREQMSARLGFDVDRYVIDVCLGVRDSIVNIVGEIGLMRLVLIKATTEPLVLDNAGDPYFLQYEIVMKGRSGETIRFDQRQYMPRLGNDFFPDPRTARIMLLSSIRSLLENVLRNTEHECIALKAAIADLSDENIRAIEDRREVKTG